MPVPQFPSPLGQAGCLPSPCSAPSVAPMRFGGAQRGCKPLTLLQAGSVPTHFGLPRAGHSTLTPYPIPCSTRASVSPSPKPTPAPRRPGTSGDHAGCATHPIPQHPLTHPAPRPPSPPHPSTQHPSCTPPAHHGATSPGEGDHLGMLLGPGGHRVPSAGTLGLCHQTACAGFGRKTNPAGLGGRELTLTQLQQSLIAGNMPVLGGLLQLLRYWQPCEWKWVSKPVER